jgi:hypothetical protein
MITERPKPLSATMSARNVPTATSILTGSSAIPSSWLAAVSKDPVGCSRRRGFKDLVGGLGPDERLGPLFHSLIHVRMSFSSSVMLRCADLRSLRLVSSANQRATRLSQGSRRRHQQQVLLQRDVQAVPVVGPAEEHRMSMRVKEAQPEGKGATDPAGATQRCQAPPVQPKAEDRSEAFAGVQPQAEAES